MCRDSYMTSPLLAAVLSFLLVMCPFHIPKKYHIAQKGLPPVTEAPAHHSCAHPENFPIPSPINSLGGCHCPCDSPLGRNPRNHGAVAAVSLPAVRVAAVTVAGACAEEGPATAPWDEIREIKWLSRL
jgi:hypothetical protein